MHRIFLIILGIMGTMGAFFMIGSVNMKGSYLEYQNLFEYRRLHPELLPTPDSIRLTDAGHHNLYADIIWIQLIQYIGDNIGNGKYIDITEKLIHHIIEIHPHFTKAYEIGLLLTPSFDPESPSYTSGNEKKGPALLTLADEGIKNNCDMEKIHTILTQKDREMLWKDQALRNPCTNGYIAYNAGFVASSLKENTKAEEYYLIASMQDDAPEVSKFLSILMRAKGGDYRSAAQKFFLVGQNGYDEPPYICQAGATSLLNSLEKQVTITDHFLSYIESIAKKIPPIKDRKNPLANSVTNCYDSTFRGIKQLFLWYITEKTKNTPQYTTGTELIQAKIISHIPKIPGQEDFVLIRKKDGTWVYRKLN